MMKLVAFDLDGTLINSLEDLAHCMNCALEEQGYPVHPVEAYRHFVGDGLATLVEHVLPFKKRDADLQAAVLNAFNRHYNKGYANLTAPYHGVDALLDYCNRHEIATAVISNKPDAFTQTLVSKLFGQNSFAFVSGKREGLAPKPNPALLFAAMEECGATPEQCLYVGDSDTDVLTAHNAGVRCAGAIWGFRGEEELKAADADFLLQNPEDLIELLKSLQEKI